MHGLPPERHYVSETRKALGRGLILPLLVLVMVCYITPWAILLLMLYPLQVVRLALRDGGNRDAWERALLLVVGKFAEMTGILEYWWRRLFNRRGKLIEYK